MTDSSSPPLIVLVGPTAVGKTAISLEIAERFNGEIISADSRLIYRGMDIGTAKPSASERARVPHHLIDMVNPDQILTLAEYQRRAYATIDDVGRRGRLPLLVGGTGQYVKAVVEGWGIPEVAPNWELRAELEAVAEEQGAEALHQQLTEMDPVAAERIDYRNIRRVVRALEVCIEAGQPISQLQSKTPPPYRILQIGLIRPREELYERIDRRIDLMLELGLLHEVKQLAGRYSWELPAMSGLGYRQIGQFLRGQVDLPAAIQLIRKETRRFVRQQATWFRLDNPQIRWFDLSQVPDTVAMDSVAHFLLQKPLSKSNPP